MKELILQMYSQFAPDVKVTNEKLEELNTYYQGRAGLFIRDFQSKVINPRGVYLDRDKALLQTYDMQAQYDEWDAVGLAEARRRRKEIVDAERVPIDVNADPLTFLPEDLFEGNKPLSQDFSDYKTLVTPFGFNMEYTTTMGVTDGVRVTAPNGETITVPYNNFEGKRKDELFDFFKNNSQPNSDEYKQAMETIATWGEYADQLLKNQLTEQEIQAVKDRLAGVDIFEREPIESQREQIPGTLLAPVPGYIPADVEGKGAFVYQEIIDEAKRLLEQDGKPATKQDVETLARNILQRQEMLEEQLRKVDAYFAEKFETFTSDEDIRGEKSKYIIGTIGTLAGVPKPEELTNRVKAIDSLISSYPNDEDVVALNEFYNKYQNVDNSEQLLFNLPENEKKIYNNLRKRAAGKLFDIQVASSDIAGKIKRLDNLPLQQDLARRSYGTLYNLGTKLANSAVNVFDANVNRLSNLPLDILGLALGKEFDAVKNQDKVSAMLRDGIERRNRQIRALPADPGLNWRFIGETVAEQLPILGSLLLTRGVGGSKLATGTMFQLGYGMRRGEYAYDEFLNPYADKIPLEEKLFVAAGHGMAEALFENLVTLRLLNGNFFGQRVMRKAVEAKLPGLSNGFKSYLPVGLTVPAAMGAESLSEVFTEISQNAFDGKDLLTNVDRAAWAGAIVGGGIQLGSFIQGLAASAGVDNKSRQILFDASQRLTVAQDKLNTELEKRDDQGNLTASPDVITALENEVGAAAQAFQKQLKAIGQYALYNPKAYDEFQKLIGYQNAIKNILSDPLVDEQTKQVKLQEYQYREGLIDLLKSTPRSIFKVLEDSPVEADRIKYNDYIKKAKKAGAANVLREAEEMYYDDVRNQVVSDYKKKFKGSLTIIEMSKAEALEYAKKMNLTQLVADITNGRLNAFNLEGQKTVAQITENAKNNYRTHSIPHEIAHEYQYYIMGTDKAKQKAVGETILKFTEKNLPDIYNSIQASLPDKTISKKDKKTGEIKVVPNPAYYKEVYALFVEYFQQNNLDAYDYAPLWHDIVSKTQGDVSDWINLDELVRFSQTHVDLFKSSEFMMRGGVQKSVEDPKGYAQRRDVINRFTYDLALEDIDEEGKATFRWDDDIANSVLNYAQRKKVFDSYIIGKRPDYTNINQFVKDVYRNLLGITRSYKPNEILDDNGRPDYFGWIMGNLNFKALDITKEYIAEQQARAKTVDIDEARGIAAEIGDDTVEDYGFSQIAEDMGVQPEIIEDIRNVILTQITNYADGLKDVENLNRDVIPFVSNIRNALTERFRLVKPFVESGNVLKMKLKKIKPIFLREVKTEYLAKNIPSLVEKQLKETGEFTLDWKGKDIARQKKLETGKTSGPQVMRKNQAALNAFTDKEFIEVYFPKGKNSQAKTEGLQKQLMAILGDEVITNDAISYARTNDFSKAPIMSQINKSGFVYEALKDIGSGQIAQVFDRAKVNKSLDFIAKLTEKKQAVLYKHANVIPARIAKGMDMESAVQMIYDEENVTLTMKQLDGISQDLIQLLDQFRIVLAAPEETKDILAEGRDVNTFKNFIKESARMLEKGDVMLSMYFQHIGVLAKGESAKDLISKENVLINQQADISFAKDYIEEFGKRAYVVAYLKFWKGTTEVAGKIMDGTLEAVKDDEGNYALIETDLKALEERGRSTDNRAQFYQAREHSRDMLVNGVLGLEGDAKLKSIIQGRTIIRYEFKDGDETIVIPREEVLLPEQDGPGGMKIPYDESSPVAKEAMNFVDRYVEYMSRGIGTVTDAGVYDDKNFYLSMAALNSNPEGALRAGAAVRYKYIGPSGVKLKYEHVIPANYILVNLIRHHAQNEITREQLDKLLSRYEVAIIPNSMDAENVKLGFTMSATYQFGDNPLFDRYYVIYNYGKKNMFAVRDTKTNDIYGQEYADAVINKSKERKDDAINSQNFVVAMRRAADPNAKTKGASIIDFDDTLAKTKSNVLYTLPNGAKGKIDATEFALRSEALEAEGAVFDFSEFSQVKAGKRGPFFGKAQALKEKFGNTDIYVLTARPQNAAPAIQKFLSGVGLDLKLENIIGLENGTPEAKANWIIDLASQGYNDILFADDAIKNTKAVAEVIDKFNIGGKVYEARLNYSKEAATPEQLSDILVGNNPDVPAIKEDIDDARAKALGQPGFWLTELFNLKRKTNLVFVPPSAEDLKGLWDNHIAGKGRKGESDKIWFEETIIRPYARAERAMDRIKLALREGYVNLKKRYGGDFVTKLYNENVTNEYTKMDAVRNYLWWNAGHDVPGLSTQDFDIMLDYVLNNEEIKNFADDIFNLINDNLKDTFITAIDVYPRPTDYWKQQDVSADIETMFKLMRPAIYQEFVENRYSVFNAENMNKIEAVYGGQFRRALEDIFFRMEEGVNRNQSQLNNPWLKWLNFATGNVMFVNVRSALLQSISATNFIELTGPNNLVNTLARVVDSKQWAEDFTTLWNSTFLKERRSRGKIDIVQEEVIKSIRTEKDPFLKLAGMLQGKGYAPTRFVDSLAIAFGGAAYYRNLVNDYVSKGMNQVQAERTAMRDFREKAESSQQSSRADLISMEQASVMGRIFLTFQNVTMQYTRLGKKAFNDMKNGRRVKNPDGTFKSLTDSRLEQAWTMAQFFVYQNLLFQGLQSAALLLMGLGEGDEVDEKRKVDYLNRAIDSILRGTGILGGALSVIKNIGIELARGNRRDLDVKVLEISPTISTKFRKAAKIINGIGGGKYKDVLIETPSFVYGLPTDRVARLLAQLEAAVDLHDQGYKSYERILMGLGWSTYDFGLPKPPTILDELNVGKDKEPEGYVIPKRGLRKN